MWRHGYSEDSHRVLRKLLLCGNNGVLSAGKKGTAVSNFLIVGLVGSNHRLSSDVVYSQTLKSFEVLGLKYALLPLKPEIDCAYILGDH